MPNRYKFDPAARRRSGATPPGNALAIAAIIIGAVTIFLIWLKFIVIFLALFFILVNIAGILMAVSAGKKNMAANAPMVLPRIGLAVNIVSLVIYLLGFIACSVCACTVCAIGTAI